MNDPNGFSRFGGHYHLFYQHNPAASVWGPMHWGHAVTDDFITWTQLPIALLPGEAYDADGCFSGSAVADGDRHVLLYTGHVDPEPGNPVLRRETQCLAIGDGRHYRKIAGNPVIGSDLLPAGASPADFRDPKVWKEDDRWYCLIANRREDGGGQLLLYAGESPERWRFVASVLESEGNLGNMWECPDYCRLEGRDLLLWSAIGPAPSEGRFQNPQSVLWSAGRLDRRTGEFKHDTIQELDKGPDFYAPQTLSTPDGRIVLIGWMQSWHRTIPTHELGQGWAGRMTISRELHWEGECLAQLPVRELESYRGTEISEDREFSGSLRLPGVEGQRIDLELELSVEGEGKAGLKVFVGDGEETRIVWDVGKGWLILDRSSGGFPIRSTLSTHPGCQVYKALIGLDQNMLRLRVVLDRSSVEIFADGGTTVMSSTVYPKASSTGILFFSHGCSTRLRCRAWPLIERRGGS